jgi:hypothetical protein
MSQIAQIRFPTLPNPFKFVAIHILWVATATTLSRH